LGLDVDQKKTLLQMPKTSKKQKKREKAKKKEARSKNISLMGKCEKGKPTSLCVGVRREEKEKKL
jgi:hypothetical protein